ncbi:MAG: hypothetical protein JST70_07325 [Bacteroidetes bacterium]|nr:hypothetical protein [Bacteroidota bacterium]
MRILKLLFTIVIFLLGLQNLSAQQVYYEMHINKHLVGEHQCRNLKVIDLRKDKSCIGHSWETSKRNRKPIVTKKSFDIVLQDAYDKMKDSSKLGDDELVMVLYHMGAVDRSGESDGGMGTLSISADFFRGTDGQYRFLGQLDSFYEIFSPRHVTDTLLAKTTGRIYSILSRYSVTLPDEAGARIFSLEEAMDKRNKEKGSYIIYAAKRYTKGVYYTNEQFLNNTPVDTPLIKWSYLKGEENITTFYYQNEKGKRGKLMPARSYFAVSDGKNLWVGDSIGAAKMIFEDGDFYANVHFNHYYSPTGAFPTPFVFLGLATGGVVGMAIAGVVSTTIGGTVNGPAGSNKIVLGSYKARLDPATGRFIPIAWIR